MDKERFKLNPLKEKTLMTMHNTLHTSDDILCQEKKEDEELPVFGVA